MSEENYKIIKFNCFSSFKIDNNKEKQMTIHETIKDNKKFILDFFSKQQYFDELMPKIKKVSRGTNFYNGLIRKGIKHKSVFFQHIMKTIKKINEEKKYKSPKSVKRIRLYKLPKIEELKLKKKRIENNNKKKKIKILQIEKNKNIANEIKSYPSTTIHSKIKISFKKTKLAHSNTLNFFNNSLMRGNNTSTNFYKKGNSTEQQHSQNNLLLSPGYNDISTYYNSNLNSNSLYKSDSIVNNSYNILKRAKSLNYMNNFLNKCQEEIVTGKEMEEKVNDYNQKFTKEIQEKLNNNRLINRDYKVILEEKKKKNKYMKLEEINYAKIKRKMNEKISTSFAYRNRKELQEILKINTNAKAIILHLNEMNKINEKMGRRRIIERKRIDEINSLCETGFRKKEYLKNKIDIINLKNKEMNKLNQSCDFLPSDNMIKNDNGLKGTLLPKLISLKKEAEKKIKIGTSLNNMNH